MFSVTTKEAANLTKESAEYDIKNTAQGAKREARKTMDEMAGDAAEYASKAGSKVRGMLDSASEEFHEASGRVSDEIRSNPIRSSVVALLAGFALGVIFRR